MRARADVLVPAGLVLLVVLVGALAVIGGNGDGDGDTADAPPTPGTASPAGRAPPTITRFLRTDVTAAPAGDLTPTATATLDTGTIGLVDGGALVRCGGVTSRVEGDPDWPAQVRVAAGERYAADRGCTSEVPAAGRTQSVWALPLLRDLSRAAYAVGGTEGSAGTLSLTLTAPGFDPLDLIVSADPPALPDAETVTLGGGTALVAGDRVAFRCHPGSVVAADADDPAVVTLLSLIQCRPTPPR